MILILEHQITQSDTSPSVILSTTNAMRTRLESKQGQLRYETLPATALPYGHVA